MNKLSILHNSKKTTAIIIFFVLTSTLITFEVQSLQAALVTTQVVYYDFPSYGIVGQTREILIQISPNPPSGSYLGCQLVITAPDGATILLDSTSNATGFVSFSYEPSVVGTYNINNFLFPGQNISADNYTSLNVNILQPWDVSTIQDLTPPTGSIVVNNDTASTSNILVNLALSANDDLSKVKSMRFSNDGTSWSSWEPYTVFTPSPINITTKAWNLTSGNGVKTVYIQFMDEAGLTSIIHSDIITLNVQATSDPRPFVIAGAIVAIIILIGAVYIQHVLKSPNTQNLPTEIIDACASAEKLNKDLEEEKYEQCIEDLKDLIEKTEGLSSSSKPLCEINKPPYSVVHNLEDVKKILSEKLGKETMTEFLAESEIKPYLLGLACVFNTFRNLKRLKPMRRGDSSSSFFAPMISQESGLFDYVNQWDKSDPVIKDFFFTWINVEVEPIRIYFAGGKTVGARSRWHWIHIDISKPYVDEKGRIEVLILPHFHTPIIRRSREDICFEVFAKCYFAVVRDYKLVFNQPVEDEVTSPGLKKSHQPEVNYKGWEIRFGEDSIKK